MKNKKRIFAAFAAAAVAVSMFAFAGCGSAEPDRTGAIEGNYEEKTDEETTEIIDKIDTDKVFEDMTTENAAINMGLKVNLEGSVGMADTTIGSGSVKLDYKMSSGETDAAGTGTMTVKADYTNPTDPTAKNNSLNLSGTLYNNTEWVYASLTGLSKDAMKAKINMNEIMAEFGDEDSDGNVSASPASYLEAEEAINISAILAMVKEYSVKVAIDDTDGVKIKLSATEETVWKLATDFGSEYVDEELLAEIKEAVTFNKFVFDVYFAIDSEGKFSAASVVMDMEADVDPSIILKFLPSSPSSVAEADADFETPALNVKIKGSVEIYTHNDKVEIPSSVTNDKTYIDMTEQVIERMHSENEDGGNNNTTV